MYYCKVVYLSPYFSENFRQRKEGDLLKRALCALFAVVMAVTGMSFSVTAQAVGNLDGETSREEREIYPGVEMTKYVLGSSSVYNIQEFSTVEFDPKQDDLYFDVTCGGEWTNKLYKTSSTVDYFNETNGEGKTAIAAVNGDAWLTSSSLDSESETGTVGTSGSRSVVVPRGFTMYGGEIICTSAMAQEGSDGGASYSFGISADGEALIGNVFCNVQIRNRSSGYKVAADGINRLPADNALVMYTDRGTASAYTAADAYEVVIDCDYDYIVRQGAFVNGTVASVVKPGEEKLPMEKNRIILTARGDRIGLLEDFKAGDEVSFFVGLVDSKGNADKWLTVTDCVGCHTPIAAGDSSEGLTDAARYPVSLLGVRSNGKVVMLTSYGHQGSAGYSYGFRLNQLDELCGELGIQSAVLLSTGSGAAMVTVSDSGYELTGRPSAKHSDGSYGNEGGVINTVVLSFGESRIGAHTREFDFNTTAKPNQIESANSANAKLAGYSMALLADGRTDPNIQFSNMGADASKYNYLTITARTTGEIPQNFKLGIFVEVGDTYSSVNTAYKQVKFDSTGDWQTLVIELSDIDAWYGRIFGPEDLSVGRIG